MKNRDRIMGMIERGQYRKLGDAGILLKAFNQIGIPWDLGTVEGLGDIHFEDGELVGEGGPLKAIHISIPPNAEEPQVAIFSFTPEGKFNAAYVENAEPLGYQVDPDMPDELRGGWLNATDKRED